MTFTRPSRNLPLPLSSASVSTTKVHICCIQGYHLVYSHLNTPHCSTSSCLCASQFRYRNHHPFSQFLPPSDKLLLILKESSHLYCLHEPPKQLPTPFCVLTIYLLFTTLLHLLYFTVIIQFSVHFSHQSVSFFQAKSVYCSTRYHEQFAQSLAHRKCSIKVAE